MEVCDVCDEPTDEWDEFDMIRDIRYHNACRPEWLPEPDVEVNRRTYEWA